MPGSQHTDRQLPRLAKAIRGHFLPHVPADARAESRLPPGGHDDLDALERADRTALTKRAEIFGPVFTGISHGELCVVIMGLQPGRRMLLENADSLRPYALDATSLVPKGVLRDMQGADHREYRRPMVRAAKAGDPAHETAILERVIRHHLDEFVRFGDTSPRALISATSATATSILVALFFGVEPGCELAQRLAALYYELGPYGLAWNIGPPQHAAYGALRGALEAALEARRNGDTAMNDRCVLAQVADESDGDVEETMLGNLIFAVEIARMDTANQLRWLTRYAALNPSILAQISAEVIDGNVGHLSLADAFSWEELRSDQSERLTRTAQCDIEFDGYLIPAGSHVRVCLWEAHHDSDSFPSPERFDPHRFLGPFPTNDQFAPFGVDHHQCPFGSTAVRIGSTYVRLLATEFPPTLINDGPPVRGAYHWEPARRLAVSLQRLYPTEPVPDPREEERQR